MGKKSITFLQLLFIISSCIPTSLAQTPTITPTLSPTVTPTPTPDPYGDPDGDTYPTRFEQIWGTDPLEFTSFEELSIHPGTIYAKMRVSQPFEIEDMNGTLYQVVKINAIEDNGTPDYASDDHLIFEVVLFPYAKFDNSEISIPINKIPISSESHLDDKQIYLKSTEVSDITQKMQVELNKLLSDSKNIRDLIDTVINWNKKNFTVNEELWGSNLTYLDLVSIKSSDMFERKQTKFSTTRSTLLASELRAIGLPTAIIFGVYTTNETNQTQGGYMHPQNLVWINNQWVRVDYNAGLNYSVQLNDPFSYGYLVFTDLYADPSEPDWEMWSNVLDNYKENSTYEERWWRLHKPLEFREN